MLAVKTAEVTGQSDTTTTTTNICKLQGHFEYLDNYLNITTVLAIGKEVQGKADG